MSARPSGETIDDIFRLALPVAIEEITDMGGRPDQGHAPLLAEPDIIQRVAAFVAACEQTSRH